MVYEGVVCYKGSVTNLHLAKRFNIKYKDLGLILSARFSTKLKKYMISHSNENTLDGRFELARNQPKIDGKSIFRLHYSFR